MNRIFIDPDPPHTTNDNLSHTEFAFRGTYQMDHLPGTRKVTGMGEATAEKDLEQQQCDPDGSAGWSD